MIEFRWSKADKKHNNTPVISDAEMDELAEALVRDYKPRLLNEPSKINYLHFLESYLEATIECHDIFYRMNEKPILGATTFNKERVPLFDRETMSLKSPVFENRTIILDNTVMQAGMEELALFTGLHEGGHLWMHPAVYAKDENQLSLFDLLPEKDEAELSPVVCCRKQNIENFYWKGGKRTPEEWREHQADYMASAIAMPKCTFLPFATEEVKKLGFSKGVLVTGTDYEIDECAEHTLPRIIAEAYGVSKTAAKIKLRKFGFITDAQTYGIRKSQGQLF